MLTIPQFEARLPARKFRGYQCMISSVAKAKTFPEDGAITSLEKPIMDGTVQVVEDIRAA
jgi:hypothetical protein